MAKINTGSSEQSTVHPDCGIEHDRTQKCHWVIMRDDGKAIWKYPVRTKADCVAEMSFENLSGYHPEHRFG